MRTETIRIEMLFKGGGRPIEWPKVESLMESMTQLGLLHPIIVRRAVRPGVRPVVGPGFTHFDAYEIIAGNHRYEAAKLLKWETVPCTVVEMDDLHAELAQLHENLMRAELSDAERISATRRCKAIYEK
jgi:ParB family chromosome partitioning protein